VHPQLGANGQTREWFWHRRSNVETDREGTVRCSATANGAWIDRRFTTKHAYRVMRISKLCGIETLVIAPDFAPNLCRNPVVDRVGEILRSAICVGIS